MDTVQYYNRKLTFLWQKRAEAHGEIAVFVSCRSIAGDCVTEMPHKKGAGVNPAPHSPKPKSSMKNYVYFA